MEFQLHILFITDNYPPEVNAPATRTYEHIRFWAEKGAKITVITCFPNFPKGKIFDGYKNSLIKKELDDENITVIRVLTYISQNSGTIKRIVDYFSFAVSSFIASIFIKKVDVIIATSPQFFTTWSGSLLSFLKRIPWVFELRDIWPASIVTVGAMKKGFFIKMLEKIEKHLYHAASLIVPVTASFISYLKTKGINENKIEMITNGVIKENFKPIPKDRDLYEKLNINGRFVVGYTGTIGMAHALDFIIESINSANKMEHFFFIFAGDGAERKRVQETAANYNLSNVLFTGMLPKDEMKKYISLFDAALVNLRKSDLFKDVIPSKIFEMAAMEKPMICGIEGESKNIIEKFNAGIFFEPENRDEFISKLEHLRKNESELENLKQGCKKLAENYDRKKLAYQMYDRIEKLVKEGR